ncbi:RICIN domain-containing protein [Pontibacter sp. G13]|uniref:RICIN domain-containing protein n=1 Tax=Pontibacter sp. G13 TaxID=3074898 RepID=UPI00288916EE|nr:RICIN domain-containing protein [Pontibacter sp. G13]WNJ17339.1 RICIN domain-containing protein [Pontibacter sp. G13]
MKKHLLLPMGIYLLFMVSMQAAFGQTSPTFSTGQDPKPSDKTWKLVEGLSDEFNGTFLDSMKWKNTDPTKWIGRAPGLFQKSAVSVANGDMRITNDELPAPETVNGTQFTHSCGHVISQNRGQVGFYFEARFKANKTFMSSTFWLINYKNEFSGCDSRTTELDIQECVGQINTTAGWAQSFDETIHSNTHSRNVTCNEPEGSEGGNAPTSGKVYDDYHVYGAWWKSPTEVQFFLDGQHVYTVTPKADFDLPMYIKLVTETYDWNPVPADGGMTGTWADRTTYYDWVRVWRLVEDYDPSVQLISDGRYTIKNKSVERNLGAPLWAHVGNNHDAILVQPGDFNDQRWDFTHLGNNVYQIKLACCNRYLAVPDSGCVDGSNAHTSLSADSTFQQWQVSKIDGFYQLKPVHCPSHALYRKPNSGTPENQWTDNAELVISDDLDDNQLWEIFSDISSGLFGPSTHSDLGMVVSPQPVSGSDLTIRFQQPATSDVALALYGLNGQLVYERTYPNILRGKAQLKINAEKLSQLAAGMYLLKMTTQDSVVSTTKVMVK